MMFPFRYLLPALATALVATSPARADGPLDAYLPKSGSISGHVVTFSVAPEDEAISRQFRHAVQDNMDWFKRAVQSNKPGQPLPYDRRMGITEAQYQQLLHMKPDAHQGEALKLGVDRGADGAVSFKPQDAAGQVFGKVHFPSGEKVAETPFGQLSIFNAIHQTDAHAPIGVWNGAEWAQVEPKDADKPSAKIAFGKRADGGGVLYYQVAPFAGHEEQSIVVFYDLD